MNYKGPTKIDIIFNWNRDFYREILLAVPIYSVY